MEQVNYKEISELLHSRPIPSYIWAACAVASENSMFEAFTVSQETAWFELAAAIENLIQDSGEPRFSLYDYLDATINSNVPYAWPFWHAKAMPVLKGTATDEARQNLMDALVEAAELKRNTYEGRF